MTKTVTEILKQLSEHTLHYSDQDEAYYVLNAALAAHELSAPPGDGVPGPVSISYGTAEEALEAIEKQAAAGAYKNLRADDASFARKALTELRAVLNGSEP